MSAFLLPCACGTDIVVTTAQAGGSTPCPSCGRAVAVPRFRDLAALPRAEARAAPGPASGRRPWTLAHNLLLVGTLWAAVCGLASMTVRPPEMEWVTSEKIRSSVLQAATDEVFTMLRTRLVPAGVERPPTADEAKQRDRLDFYTRVRDWLRIGAGVGGVTALVGGLLFFLRGSARGTAGGRP